VVGGGGGKDEEAEAIPIVFFELGRDREERRGGKTGECLRRNFGVFAIRLGGRRSAKAV